ncbi:MAG TPA: RlmE family RNA methyltransferase [Paenalcaligenes sp.]|nr:RlmE family RNA methyltransferase [Paenalcaligenes sp.]
MSRRKGSNAWMQRHVNDPYVKKAQQQGYRARAAFKLIEILAAENLLHKGNIVVDLGAAPGSWSQVARERLVEDSGQINGRIVALDILPMDPIDGVDFILGDFREQEVLDQLEETLGGQKVDLVLSDMAPNLSGIAVADAARIEHLCELALDFAREHLRPNGALIVKTFHGRGYAQIVEAFKQQFKSVQVRKPQSSRDSSAEVFLVGRSPRN